MKKVFAICLWILLSYNLIGQSIIWSKEQSFSGGSFSSRGEIDNHGNSYALGAFGPSNGGVTDPDKGWFLTKRDNVGNLLWSDSIKSHNGPSALCLDNLGNIYLTGSILDSVFLGNGFSLKNIDNGSIPSYIAKYSSSGICQKVIYVPRVTNYEIYFNNGKLILFGDYSTDRLDTVNFNTNSGFYGEIAFYDLNLNYINDKKYEEKIFHIGRIKNNYIYTLTRGHHQPYANRIEKYSIDGDFIKYYPNILPTVFEVDSHENFYFSGTYKYSLNLGSLALISNQPGNNNQSFYARCDSTGNYKWAHNEEASAWIFLTENERLFGVNLTGNINDQSSTSEVIQIDSMGNTESLFVNHPDNFGTIKFDSTGSNVYCFSNTVSNALTFKICLENCVTGTEELASNNILFSVYPNPTESTLNIRLKASTEINNLQIKNILGQTVYQKSYDSSITEIDEVIDVSQYIKGIYLIEIFSNSMKEYKKFIVQ